MNELNKKIIAILNCYKDKIIKNNVNIDLNFDANEINQIVFEILNGNLNVTLLSCEQTRELTKNLSMINNMNDITNLMNNNSFLNILDILYDRVTKGIPSPKYFKLSTITIDKNAHICTLNLPSNLYDILIKNGINYLYELLSLSITELKKVFSHYEPNLNALYAIVHNHNFKFIDELTDLEKKYIIQVSKNYPDFNKLIDNSSVYWIGNVNEIKSYRCKTIKDLKNYILNNSPSLRTNWIGERFEELGISFISNNKISLEELRKRVNIDSSVWNLSLREIEFDGNLINFLNRNGIFDLADLRDTNKNFLISLPKIGTRRLEKICELLNCLGIYDDIFNKPKTR